MNIAAAEKVIEDAMKTQSRNLDMAMAQRVEMAKWVIQEANKKQSDESLALFESFQKTLVLLEARLDRIDKRIGYNSRIAPE